MRKPPSDQAVPALAPVRAELLRTARTEAREVLDRADQESRAVIGEARTRARSIIEGARRQGEEEGAAAAHGIRADARRTARACELATRKAAYEELRRRAFAHVRQKWGPAGQPAVGNRLRERALWLLGPDAEIIEAPGGGVVARAAGRRAECTPDSLTARALDRLGAEVETLWSQ
ncbi:hypothetical protein HUT19_01520 [Streptomyces sp. NA02950]|uniref:hypothetical protein n=1 Tax=Streptomyces sp. NA02950 TaxID=2742137 RepID=UPI0015906774|nr:hypothetical protein [Streptomyces sp. NA02950]QKV90347.1 hypothetical protein HUT19_01520 [Streptomyces sp. NA02950]